jgi:membrane-associated phospholipid phosphatase
MLHRILYFITDFGDVAYLFPAALVVLAYLVYLRARPSAVAWAVAFAACGSLTALLKIGFLACGAKVPFLDVYTPSGHTSFATTFYLGIGLLLSRNRTPLHTTVLIAVAVCMATIIALSRVVLEMHSAGDVVAGLLIGVACVIWFASKYYGAPQPGLPMLPALGLLVTLALFSHGQHLSRESWFKFAAEYIQTHLAVCV